MISVFGLSRNYLLKISDLDLDPLEMKTDPKYRNCLPSFFPNINRNNLDKSLCSFVLLLAEVTIRSV